MARLGKFFYINGTDNLSNAHFLRVRADGGITESLGCIDTAGTLLESASFFMRPSGYKEDTVYSLIPNNSNGSLSFTRASDAWRTDIEGLIQRVPWNLLSYSEQFTNSAWSKSSATITADTTISPNGTLTADTIAFSTAGFVVQSFTHNGLMTFSLYAKYIATRWVCVENFNSVDKAAWFDLQNGVVGSTINGATSTITNVGDGWYRCTVTMTAVNSSASQYAFFTVSADSSFTRSGSAYFWGAQLVEGSSAQTYFPTTDRLNVPRLSYMYGSCPALLLEPQRTNLAFPSEDFSTTWLTNNTTVTTNQTTAPDGNTTADRISITSNGGFIRRFSLTVLNSTTYTISAFVKNDTITSGNTFRFYFNNNLGSTNAAEARAVIDINAGTATAQSTGSGVSNVSASITSLTNSWYRVQVTFTLGATSGNNSAEIGFDAPTATRTFFAWGAQLELGAYPTTYIPTTTASATRIADSFSRNNIYTNGLITSSGGTWFVELRNNIAYTRDNSNININLDDSSGFSNGFALRNSLGTGRLAIQKTISSSSTLLYTTTTDTVKIAIKWNGSTADVFVNGTKQVSATAFSTTQLQNLLTSMQVPVFIQQMALFNYPLSDSDCQLLTT